MPYPPKNTFGQTEPSTALEPPINPSVIGLGNADTVPATSNDPSMIGFPMAPYDDTGILTLVADVTGADFFGWNGGVLQVGTGGGTQLMGAMSFVGTGVPSDSAKIESAILGLRTTNTAIFLVPPHRVRGHEAANPDAPGSGNLPTSWDLTTELVAASTAVPPAQVEVRELDVTDIIKEILDETAYQTGNRINLVLQRTDTTAGVMEYDFASLTITLADDD